MLILQGSISYIGATGAPYLKLWMYFPNYRTNDEMYAI